MIITSTAPGIPRALTAAAAAAVVVVAAVAGFRAACLWLGRDAADRGGWPNDGSDGRDLPSADGRYAVTDPRRPRGLQTAWLLVSDGWNHCPWSPVRALRTAGGWSFYC